MVKTTANVARDLGVSQRTVQRMAKEGRIDAERVGHSIVIHEDGDVVRGLARLRGSDAPPIKSA